MKTVAGGDETKELSPKSAASFGLMELRSELQLYCCTSLSPLS